MNRFDRWEYDSQMEAMVADDLAETAARALTGDLNPDGSWSTTIRSAAPAAPSIAPVAIGAPALLLGTPAAPLLIAGVGLFVAGAVLSSIFDW